MSRGLVGGGSSAGLALEVGDQHAAALSTGSGGRNSRNTKYEKAKWRLKAGCTEKEEEREGMKRKIM